MRVRAKETNNRYAGLPELLPTRKDFWHIPRMQHDTIYILGGGGSFKKADPECLRDKFVIGCNEAFQLGSELVNYCHFTDLQWWQQHGRNLSEYQGTVTTCQQLVHDERIKILKGRPRGIEFKDSSIIGVNRNTGLGAINIAVHMKATRIVLLGFDMGAGEDGHHWYARTDKGNRDGTYRMHRKFALEVWEDIRAHGGIEILNASPNSTLPFWPKVKLSEVL